MAKVFVIKELGGIKVYADNKDIDLFFIDKDTLETDVIEEQKESQEEFEKNKNKLKCLYATF